MSEANTKTDHLILAVRNRDSNKVEIAVSDATSETPNLAITTLLNSFLKTSLGIGNIFTEVSKNKDDKDIAERFLISFESEPDDAYCTYVRQSAKPLQQMTECTSYEALAGSINGLIIDSHLSFDANVLSDRGITYTDMPLVLLARIEADNCGNYYCADFATNDAMLIDIDNIEANKQSCVSYSDIVNAGGYGDHQDTGLNLHRTPKKIVRMGNSGLGTAISTTAGCRIIGVSNENHVNHSILLSDAFTKTFNDITGRSFNLDCRPVTSIDNECLFTRYSNSSLPSAPDNGYIKVCDAIVDTKANGATLIDLVHSIKEIDNSDISYELTMSINTYFFASVIKDSVRTKIITVNAKTSGNAVVSIDNMMKNTSASAFFPVEIGRVLLALQTSSINGGENKEFLISRLDTQAIGNSYTLSEIIDNEVRFLTIVHGNSAGILINMMAQNLFNQNDGKNTDCNLGSMPSIAASFQEVFEFYEQSELLYFGADVL